MVEFLSSLLSFSAGQDGLTKAVFALLILVLGHLTVKLSATLGRKYWADRQDLNKKELEERYEVLEYGSYLLDAGVIFAALLYLNTGLSSDLFTQFTNYIPRIISAVLIAILGFIGINLSTKIGKDFLKGLGAQGYFREVGLSGSSLTLLSGLVKGFLYLLLLQIALGELGIGNGFISQLVTASSWAAALLIAGLLFYGFKDLFQNYAAGIYLKNSRMVRPGEEVDIEGRNAKINKVSLFSTSLDTDTGRTLVTPNTKLMNSDIAFKRTKSDLETLEDIKSYFIAEKPEYTGSASIVMAMEIFGYRITQQEVAEELEDDGQEEIAELVEQKSEQGIRTGFVEHPKITDLGAELKTWFNDGSIVLTKIDKNEVFPESQGEQYILCVGIEEQEVLVIDPSADGGVYYIDTEKLHRAIGGAKEPGYIVMAPEGTTAFWRIKNDLIYSDKNYYDELSKTLESRLTKIMRQGRLLQKSMPSALNDYMDKWRKHGDVTRLWSPDEE